MELASLLTTESYSLLVILTVLIFILRSSPKIPNWLIQWIVLVVALGLSYIQAKTFDINVILNAFIATGVCLFGENAIYRKKSEKSIEEAKILEMLEAYKREIENKNQCEVNLHEELKNMLGREVYSDNNK